MSTRECERPVPLQLEEQARVPGEGVATTADDLFDQEVELHGGGAGSARRDREAREQWRVDARAQGLHEEVVLDEIAEIVGKLSVISNGATMNPDASGGGNAGEDKRWKALLRSAHVIGNAPVPKGRPPREFGDSPRADGGVSGTEVEDFRKWDGQHTPDRLARRVQGALNIRDPSYRLAALEDIRKNAGEALLYWQHGAPHPPGVEVEKGSKAWKIKIANEPRGEGNRDIQIALNHDVQSFMGYTDEQAVKFVRNCRQRYRGMDPALAAGVKFSVPAES